MLSFSPSFFPLFPPVSLIAFNSPFLHLRTLCGCKIAHKIEKKKHDTWYASNTRERKQTILPSSIPGSPVFSINLNSYQSSHVNYVHTGNNGNIQSRFRIIQFIQSFALNFSTPPRNSEMFSALLKRNSIYVATIFGGAFAFQAFFDASITKWYENHNKGKLWKDVKGKFLEGGDEEEDDDE